MPKVFISYRREDSPGYAGRLYDRLHDEFGSDNVFIDVDTIQPGDDFVDVITGMLSQCDVVLAVIGPRWLAAADDRQQRRLDDETDFVRVEIQTALERRIRVIPVLVEQAKLPKSDELPAPLQGLVRRQVLELSDTRWAYDVGRLLESLHKLAGAATGQNVESPDGPGPSAPPAAKRTSSSLKPGPSQQTGPAAAVPVRKTDAPHRKASSAPAYVPSTVKIVVNQRLLAKIDYEKWLSGSLTVSPDNRHVAFIEQRSRFLGITTSYLVNLDGVAGKEHENLTKRLTFSNDGARLAYGAKKDSKWLVVADGREGQLFDDLSESGAMFSSDGEHLAYGALTNGKWTVVLDGQDGQRFDGLLKQGLIFSPDSQHLAYGALTNSKWMVVVDGQEGQLFDALSVTGLVFSADSEHLAYGARRGDEWTVVVDGQEGKAYDGLADNYLAFSADGQRLAFGAVTGDKWTVVVDGQEGQPFDGLWNIGLVFSPDGRRLAYGAHVDKKWTIVVDGQESKWYDDLGEAGLVFSPDGRRLAYGARAGEKWTVVVDERESKTYDGLAANHFVFSPDGGRLAFSARSGDQWMVVADGQEGKPYAGIGTHRPVFSPDGRHLAYTAKTSSGWVVVVDGKETPIYEGTVRGSRILFETADRLRLLTLKGQEVYATTLDIG